MSLSCCQVRRHSSVAAAPPAHQQRPAAHHPCARCQPGRLQRRFLKSTMNGCGSIQAALRSCSGTYIQCTSHIHAYWVTIPGGSACVHLQVPGCGKDLSRDKEYFKRYRVCRMHSNAREVRANIPVYWLAAVSADRMRGMGRAADSCSCADPREDGIAGCQTTPAPPMQWSWMAAPRDGQLDIENRGVVARRW